MCFLTCSSPVAMFSDGCSGQWRHTSVTWSRLQRAVVLLATARTFSTHFSAARQLLQCWNYLAASSAPFGVRCHPSSSR